MGVKFRLIISLIFLYTQNIQSGIISAYKAYSARRQQRLQSAQQSLKLLNKENRRHYKAIARDFDKIIKGIVSRLDELQLYLETENWSNAQISMLLDNIVNIRNREKIKFLRENGYSYLSTDQLLTVLHKCNYNALHNFFPEFSNSYRTKNNYKLFAQKLVALDLVNFRYKTSVFKDSSACERTVENRDFQTTQFLLAHGDHANANEKILLKSDDPKITRLLMLYGAPIPEPIQYQIELNDHVWPAISSAMKAAVLGDITEFDNLVRNRKNKQAILNSALRYAATNLQLAMVQHLLESGANPYAECPDVVAEVKSSFKLIKILRDRQDNDSSKYKLYDSILDMFTTDNSLGFFIRKHTALFKSIEARIRPELIPTILFQVFPELTDKICNKIYFRYAGIALPTQE
ncbi:hypothetical protein A3F66_03230 [candidate division TM6 bacterium RIFCSPHIGHO2_12_FULL_32_22]|nr:MAG: hypothetical protein A3F66_03230 [candidate division TM6 bacterium RIFCSPHIGHO2_12_FULL_32_22]